MHSLIWQAGRPKWFALIKDARRALSVCALLVGVFLVACPGSHGPAVVSPEPKPVDYLGSTPPDPPNPDPLSADSAKRDSAARADESHQDSLRRYVTPALTQLASMKWRIPEFHDEQAFPIWAHGTPPAMTSTAGAGIAAPAENYFGPIVKMYASPHLEDFKEPWQIREQGTRGVLVSVIFLDPKWGDPAFVAPLPEPYTRLGLRRGINCLWLALPTTSGGWKGYISPAKDSVCDAPAERTELRVVASHFDDNGEDYPPVARFSETETGQPLFGVPCLKAWCEFGPMDTYAFTGSGLPTPPWKPQKAFDVLGRREGRIKGWYDEQWLSLPVDGKLRPGIRAAVFPAADLQKKADSSFYLKKVRVGSVFLYAEPPSTSRYYKWGMRKGWNAVFIWWWGGEQWRMHFESINEPFNNPTWIAATRMTHQDAVPPGSARFRSTSPDELWFECGVACCRSTDSTS